MSQAAKSRGYQLSVELVAGEAEDDRIIGRLEAIKSRRDGGKAGFVRRALIAYIEAEVAGRGVKPQAPAERHQVVVATAQEVVAVDRAPAAPAGPGLGATGGPSEPVVGGGERQSAGVLSGFMDGV